jgi:hypothetical protein
MGAFDRPAAPGLDRGWLAAGGDLAGERTVGQNLAAGLVVVAGVQLHHRMRR